MSGLDLPLLAASLTAAAVLVLVYALAPGALRRRAVGARLGQIVVPAPAGMTDRPQSAVRAARRRPRGAGLRLPSARTAWFAMAAVVVAAVLIPTGDVALSAAAGLQVLVVLILRDRDLRDGRTRLLDVQTLPMLLRLAAALRAGSSLVQALQYVARDAPYPTSEEFGRSLDEIAMGVSVDDALDRLATRAGTPEYQALAVALSVQRRVGGNLAVVLDSLAEGARERIELRQELAVLTAQQRLQCWVLVGLPYIILGALWLMDRSYLEPMFTTNLGRGLVLLASVMLAVGSWTLRWAGSVEA